MGDKNIYKLKEVSDCVPLYEVDYTRKTKDCIYELLDSLNLSVVDLNISRSNNLP